MICLSAYMYRQISQCTDKFPNVPTKVRKGIIGGAIAPPAPPPPSGYANGLQLWLSTGHVEMVENEKNLHSNSAKIAVPDWSILRSVKEPRFRITPSRADVPLIPE